MTSREALVEGDAAIRWGGGSPDAILQRVGLTLLFALCSLFPDWHVLFAVPVCLLGVHLIRTRFWVSPTLAFDRIIDGGDGPIVEILDLSGDRADIADCLAVTARETQVFEELVLSKGEELCQRSERKS